MGKLRALPGNEVCRILERNGFVAARQSGSHRIMQKRIEGTTITVPFLFTMHLSGAHYRASLGNPSCRALALKLAGKVVAALEQSELAATQPDDSEVWRNEPLWNQ